MSSSVDNFYVVTGAEDRVKAFAASLRSNSGKLSHDNMEESESPGKITFYHWSTNRPDTEYANILSDKFPDVEIRCVFHSAEGEFKGIFVFCNFFYFTIVFLVNL